LDKVKLKPKIKVSFIVKDKDGKVIKKVGGEIIGNINR
jgi:hypothetical protein